MKLNCEIEIACYLHNTGAKLTKGRPTHACLAVGHHSVNSSSNNKQMFILVNTHSNRVGTRYKVSRNVVNLFTRFKDDGKATIRFKDPPHDIIIKKADPVQLKSFLLFVTLGKNEKVPENLHLTSLPSQSGYPVVKPKTKMTICKQADYPGLKGFPRHLVILRINGCNLKKVDFRIFNLKHLEILDLNNNWIKCIPKQIENLTKLKELSLSCNLLKAFPLSLCAENILSSLQSLILDHNEIEELPKEICFFQRLSKLSLAHNLLTKLPVCIGNLKNLLELRIPYNHIKIFPSSIVWLSLSFFDISGNPLSRESPPMDPNNSFQVPTLLEQSCRKIYKHRIPYGPSVIPKTLCDHLKCFGLCLCGNPVFQDGTSCLVLLNLQHVAHTIQFINGDLRFNFPMERILCSPACKRKRISRK